MALAERGAGGTAVVVPDAGVALGAATGEGATLRTGEVVAGMVLADGEASTGGSSTTVSRETSGAITTGCGPRLGLSPSDPPSDFTTHHPTPSSTKAMSTTRAGTASRHG